jgi:hypothetical protein
MASGEMDRLQKTRLGWINAYKEVKNAGRLYAASAVFHGLLYGNGYNAMKKTV